MAYLFTAGLITALAVAGVAYFLKLKWLPIAALGLVIGFLVNPFILHSGTEMAKDQATAFNEYWNGFETAAVRSDRTCERDGSCRNTYSCDPYTVLVTKTRIVSDGKGGTTTETYTELETRYHSCPYSQQESDFVVQSTLDNYTIASGVMTGAPFRHGTNIPGGQVTTPPAAWAEAKARIDSGKPGPVTAVNTYKNFILASQDSLFKAYADNIDDLKAKGLLPAPSKGVFGFYHATKAYKAGTPNVPLFDEYVTDVEYLNGAVGDDLHGDLHLVFVPEDVEGGKDDYLNTLTAYWQSEEHGRDAISKNAIIIVIGASADGKQVAWAKATTGMPVGNEAMLTQIASDLKGKPLDKNLLGRPSMDLASGEIAPSAGILEGILWGENGFVRVSMSGGDADDEGTGFAYLREELKPSTGAMVGISIVNFLVAGGLLTALVFLAYSDPAASRLLLRRHVPTPLERFDQARYEIERNDRHIKNLRNDLTRTRN